jgi:hypothetical protein
MYQILLNTLCIYIFIHKFPNMFPKDMIKLSLDIVTDAHTCYYDEYTVYKYPCTLCNSQHAWLKSSKTCTMSTYILPYHTLCPEWLYHSIYCPIHFYHNILYKYHVHVDIYYVHLHIPYMHGFLHYVYISNLSMSLWAHIYTKFYTCIIKNTIPSNILHICRAKTKGVRHTKI